MIAKRNEFVKKTAGRGGGGVEADGAVRCGAHELPGRRGVWGRDMEILILKRVWKNFGARGPRARRRRENFNFT